MHAGLTCKLVWGQARLAVPRLYNMQCRMKESRLLMCGCSMHVFVCAVARELMFNVN